MYEVGSDKGEKINSPMFKEIKIMAYTLANLQDDIRDYTEVDSAVLSNSVT